MRLLLYLTLFLWTFMSQNMASSLLELLVYLCSDSFWPTVARQRAGETSIEIKLRKNELGSLTGQSLIGKIGLFRAVS